MFRNSITLGERTGRNPGRNEPEIRLPEHLTSSGNTALPAETPPANSRLFVKIARLIKISSKQAFSGAESLFFYLSFLRKRNPSYDAASI